MQSHTPGVACSISNGQSLAGSANVTGAMVSCSPGTETILHTFGCCATDGELPNGNLIMDSAGDPVWNDRRQRRREHDRHRVQDQLTGGVNRSAVRSDERQQLAR